MYEKIGEYEKSLSDINYVLSINPTHFKCIFRKARIYVSQGKLFEAFVEYNRGIMLKTIKGEVPEQEHTEQAEAICFKLVSERTIKYYTDLFSETSSPIEHKLPSNIVCLNFFEAYPSFYLWKAKFKNIDRESLSVTFNSALEIIKKNTEEENKENNCAQVVSFLTSALDLIKFDIVNSRFKSAFEILKTIQELQLDTKYTIPARITSLLYDFIASEAFLLYNIKKSIQYFKKAIELNKKNLDSHLKLFYLNCENPSSTIHYLESEISKIQELFSTSSVEDEEFSDALTSPSIDDMATIQGSIATNWILLHNTFIYTIRNEAGKFYEGSADSYSSLLESVLKSTESYESLPSDSAQYYLTAGVRFLAALKINKAYNTFPTIDQKKYAHYFGVARSIFSRHESILTGIIEELTVENDLDGAQDEIEKFVLKGFMTNTSNTYYSLKAIVLFHRGLASAQYNQELFFACFNESISLLNKTLDSDPYNVYNLFLLSQIYLFLGNVTESIQCLKTALSAARGREDYFQFQIYYVNTEAKQALN